MAPLKRFFSRGSVIFSANSGSTQTPSSTSFHSDSVSLAGSSPLLALQSVNLLTISQVSDSVSLAGSPPLLALQSVNLLTVRFLTV
ncbi:hypothetical protein RRG08_026593 [Elysia crispata]|uniref:Uncharacterized protein n=1 Tax=Elysia crispata TaxID=231223 RepID=A0AAE0XZ63_9GAST|nr:hypothetical protein RRG08_026593 [Elysia crispata]